MGNWADQPIPRLAHGPDWRSRPRSQKRCPEPVFLREETLPAAGPLAADLNALVLRCGKPLHERFCREGRSFPRRRDTGI